MPAIDTAPHRRADGDRTTRRDPAEARSGHVRPGLPASGIPAIAPIESPPTCGGRTHGRRACPPARCGRADRTDDRDEGLGAAGGHPAPRLETRSRIPHGRGSPRHHVGAATRQSHVCSRPRGAVRAPCTAARRHHWMHVEWVLRREARHRRVGDEAPRYDQVGGRRNVSSTVAQNRTRPLTASQRARAAVSVGCFVASSKSSDAEKAIIPRFWRVITRWRNCRNSLLEIFRNSHKEFNSLKYCQPRDVGRSHQWR